MHLSPSVLARPLIMVVAIILSACSNLIPEKEFQAARANLASSIQSESTGSHFIGRRVYKRDYRMWGYLRAPGQPWSTAKLVVFNEQRTYAPDREMNDFGGDNDHEYFLHGRFSGHQIYEPSSNRAFPEFILSGWALKSENPPPIFRDRRATKPTINIFPDPE